MENTKNIPHSEKSIGNSFFQIDDYRDDFPHRNLVEFNYRSVDDLNLQEPIYHHYKPIVDSLAFQVFQDSSLVSHALNEWTKTLYSIQKTQGFQAILIAGMDDNWIDKIQYYTYSEQGELVDHFTVYETGGDGGYTTDSFGEFINDSTYHRTTVECKPIDISSSSCDTTQFLFRISPTGRITSIGFEN